MNNHTPSQEALAEDESMIDARQASFALRLPYYWFADPRMRAAKRIPHYQFLRLIRFRLSELEAWQRQNVRPDDIAASNQGGGDA